MTECFHKCTDMLATRECLESSVWDPPNVSSCRSDEFVELEEEIKSRAMTANLTTLVMFSSALSTITSSKQLHLPQDVVTASNTLAIILK